MKYLAVISSVIATLAILAFGVQIWKTNTPQNVASWLMWLILNTILLFASISAGNKKSWMLSLGYVIGGAAGTAALLFRGQWHWGKTETVCAVGAAVSMMVWKKLGPKKGLVVSAIAITMAGIPALSEAWQTHNRESWWLWTIIAFCCLLTTIGAERWTLQDRLFPIVSMIFNGTMAVLVLL